MQGFVLSVFIGCYCIDQGCPCVTGIACKATVAGPGADMRSRGQRLQVLGRPPFCSQVNHSHNTLLHSTNNQPVVYVLQSI